jgi:myo-inositol-1-phosphate synthase
MSRERIGVWIIGARGNVATTAIVGLCGLARGIAPPVGLVTELPLFAGVSLPDWGDLVIAGHDIRSESLVERARQLAAERVVPGALVEQVAEDLTAIDRRIRPGITYGCGERIDSLADLPVRTAASPRQMIQLVADDLAAFRRDEQLDRVVVVYLASTEPPVAPGTLPTTWRELETQLESDDKCPVRASSLYAIAAIESGAALVNFTPSLGSSCGAIEELARERGIPLAGQDGKTGETLLKTVLAPMFAARHLQVMSWVGHNIFGNMDGRVLDDPVNKATKVRSKDAVLSGVLGYAPQTLVSIEYIESLGDWKTAWDHVHFQGFLGTPMTLQFTWQGCDSALAAPLVLDLVRLAVVSHRCGESGPLVHLASFFKSPIGTSEHDFAKQLDMLGAWCAAHKKQ